MPRAFDDTPESDVIVDSAQTELITYASKTLAWEMETGKDTSISYQGTYSTSPADGNTVTATFTFTGTQVAVWGFIPGAANAAAFGTGTISRYTIDAGTPTTFESQYIAGLGSNGGHVQMFQSGTLAAGVTHTLQVMVIARGEHFFSLDWIEYNKTTTSSGGNSGNGGTTTGLTVTDSGSNTSTQTGSNGSGSTATNSGSNTSTVSNGAGSNPQGATMTVTSPAQQTSSSSSSTNSSSSTPVGAIAGGVVAGVVLIIGIAFLAFWIGRSRRRRRTHPMDLTREEADLFKGGETRRGVNRAEPPYKDDDAPAYLTQHRPAVSRQNTSPPLGYPQQYGSAMEYNAPPPPMHAYATPYAMPAPAPAPPPMLHIPVGAVIPHAPHPPAPASDVGSASASATGTGLSSGGSNGASAMASYRNAQQEKALIYLSENGISRSGQASGNGAGGSGAGSSSGSPSSPRGTSAAAPTPAPAAPASPTLTSVASPGDGEAPPPAYVP